ncbi:SusC/RagA family TonB-linked outer membrane protein [Archangium violaceum]|uniref:SusC/RagA family TonB-linked outer membrane protein n=1 Tax=Archangium violaceum TaxID=83451 RepID=UPI00193C262D|nr:SusC/RagA family TonB-linked outer membrane protein [Archangium violaceum]QRK09709.1 SusC/RagA family TonB-linked outer membrane protein [Archangium violaceum]
MTLKQALISGCALALLSVEARAQEQGTAAPQPEAAPAEQPAATVIPAPANTRKITGKVLDALTNDGLPLTRVIIKGTTKGVETELDGTFTLDVPKGPVTLLFSSQDHKEREVTVGANRNDVTVSLDATFVEEMVVVGRASELARKNLANSVASVNTEELNRAPAATVDQALQGKVAGANIQSNSGAPGGGMQLKLRGVSTINGSSAPLYVVDGVIISDVAIASGVYQLTESVRGSNPSATQDNQVNRIADLNPNDIESIEVLKGASAAAIYGSKASNGVVIITTKKGKAGAPKVDVTQRVGMYSLSNTLGSRVFRTREEVVERYGEEVAAQYWTGKTFDQEKLLAGRRDLSYETLASVSGTAGDTRYFASAMVKDDKGIIENTGYQKQSFRLNLGQKLGSDIEVNANANLVHTLGNRGLTNNDNTNITYYMALASTPNFVDLRAQDGIYPANPFVSSRANPLQTAALMQNDEDVWRLLGSADATWTAYKSETQSFKVLANLGVDRFQQKNKLFSPSTLAFELPLDNLPGTSLFATSEVLNLNTGVNLVHNYRPQSGIVNATTSAGFQYEQSGLDTLYVKSSGQIADQENVSSGTQLRVLQNRQMLRDRGFYLQEEMLMLDERLTLVGAVRGEQSSANGDPNKLFFFPKLATAYRLQPFHPAVNEFKVRLAYGETGNRPTYIQKYTSLASNNNIEGLPAIIGTGVAGSKDIHPERQREFEAGVDAMLFNGNAVVELTVYQRNISDLLLQRTLPGSTGFTTEYTNGGELRNRGIEAMLQVTPVRNTDWEWTSNATFTLNRSTVISLPDGPFNVPVFGTSLGEFRLEEGSSATQIVGDVMTENGLELRKIGDTEPDFRVGFSNVVKYKDLSLSFLLDWQQGSDIINLTRFLYDGNKNSVDYERGLERQQAWLTDASVYVEDATFLKLREVTLSYNLPQQWLEKIPAAKTARLSISGRNLLTFTNYSGLDPEVSNFGNQAITRNVDVAPFPPSRSFWTSLDVGF